MTGRLADRIDGLNAKTRSLVVAFVVPGWPRQRFPNGIVTYTTHMRAELRRQGIRTFVLSHEMEGPTDDEDVVCLQRPKLRRSLLDKCADRVGFTIAPAFTMAWRTTSAIIRETRRLRLDFGLDLVQMEETFGWPRFVVPRSPVPVVVRLHGPWFLTGAALGLAERADFAPRVRREGRAVAMAAGISTASRAVLDQVREHYGLPLENAAVIPNAIASVPEANRWSLSGCEPNRILFIGRFDRIKGADVVIEAFQRLLRTRPRSRLTLVGPDRGFLDDAGRLHQIKPFIESRLPGALADGRIEWLDFQPSDRLAALRHRAGVTVVASRYETFPNTLLEAMVMGCPVVSSAVGGVGEILQHEHNGLACRVGDAEDMTRALSRLLETPELAARLGRQAGEDCNRRFNPTAIAAETAAFHQEVIARSQHAKSRRR